MQFFSTNRPPRKLNKLDNNFNVGKICCFCLDILRLLPENTTALHLSNLSLSKLSPLTSLSPNVNQTITWILKCSIAAVLHIKAHTTVHRPQISTSVDSSSVSAFLAAGHASSDPDPASSDPESSGEQSCCDTVIYVGGKNERGSSSEKYSDEKMSRTCLSRTENLQTQSPTRQNHIDVKSLNLRTLPNFKQIDAGNIRMQKSPRSCNKMLPAGSKQHTVNTMGAVPSSECRGLVGSNPSPSALADDGSIVKCGKPSVRPKPQGSEARPVFKDFRHSYGLETKKRKILGIRKKDAVLAVDDEKWIDGPNALPLLAEDQSSQRLPGTEKWVDGPTEFLAIDSTSGSETGSKRLESLLNANTLTKTVPLTVHAAAETKFGRKA